eukprot:1682054-Pleurochrysis_carterae.AAC.1
MECCVREAPLEDRAVRGQGHPLDPAGVSGLAKRFEAGARHAGRRVQGRDPPRVRNDGLALELRLPGGGAGSHAGRCDA